MDQQTDFERDIDRMDRELVELDGQSSHGVPDIDVATRLAGRRYHRAALSGHPADVDTAQAAVDAALRQFAGAPDLYLVKANIDFMLHRMLDVWQDLAGSPTLLESAQGRALKGDLWMQEGRYADARRAYEEVLAEDPGWDNFARLAHFEAKLGDPQKADDLYQQAADELTAKQMRSYAWVELQRGVLDRCRGRSDDALAHYKIADDAYSGYWLVQEHIAEAVGALGDFARSAAMYEAIVERVPRPELYQAIAELYQRMGEHARAAIWADRALRGYLESVGKGGVHYYHHLVDFFSDVRENGPAAVDWARKDLALRRNFNTQAALAWALFRARLFEEAARTMGEALSSGVRDAHVFSQAAAIYEAAGAVGDGRRLAELAHGLNPHLNAFHVHR